MSAISVKAATGGLMVAAGSLFILGMMLEGAAASPGGGRGLRDSTFYWNWVFTFTGVMLAPIVLVVAGFVLWVRSVDA